MPTYRGSGAQVLIAGTTVGFAESASVEISKPIEVFYQIGSIAPIRIAASNLEPVSGSLSRLWVDNSVLTFVGATAGALPSTVDIVIKVAAETGAPIISITSAMFTRGAIDVPQDGWITTDLDFEALAYTITTQA
jgi:hypothetical protein